MRESCLTVEAVMRESCLTVEAVMRVLASECDDAQRSFGGVVVDLQMSVVDEAGERVPSREGVADRRRGVGLGGELRECRFEPGLHAVEQRSCPGLTDGLPDLRRASPDLGFDGIERGDALDRLGCDGRSVRDVDLVELASCMGPARDFDDGPRLIELLEASVSIGLERTPL